MQFLGGRAPRTASADVPNVVAACHDFSIHYSSLVAGGSINYLQSRPFEVGRQHWIIKVYPQVVSGWVAAYVAPVENKVGSKSIEAEARFSLMVEKRGPFGFKWQSKVFSKDIGPITFSGRDRRKWGWQGWGRTHFAGRENLYSLARRHGDRVTIRCHLTVIEGHRGVARVPCCC